jgi:hypothetical protein
LSDFRKYSLISLYAFLVFALQISFFSRFTNIDLNFILVNIAVFSALFNLKENLVFLSTATILLQAFTFDKQFIWFLPLLSVLLKLFYTKELKDPLWLCVFYSVLLSAIYCFINQDTYSYFHKILLIITKDK